jgi:hypothetical protein
MSQVCLLSLYLLFASLYALSSNELALDRKRAYDINREDKWFTKTLTGTYRTQKVAYNIDADAVCSI